MIHAPERERAPSAVVSQQLRPRGAVRASQRRGRLLRAAYVVGLVAGDALGIALAFVTAYALRVLAEPRPNRISPLADYLPTLALLVASLLATFALRRLYLPRRGASHVDQLGSIFVAVIVGNVVAIALSAFGQRREIDWLIIVYAWGLSILFVWLLRVAIQTVMQAALRRGMDPLRVLVLGRGEELKTVLARIRGAPELGYELAGVVGERSGSAENGHEVVGSVSDLPDILERRDVQEVVVADSSLSHQELLDVVAMCDRARVGVKVLPDVFHLVVKEVSVSEFSGLPMLQVRDVNLRGWNLLVKRGLDLVGAAVLLVIFSPLLVAVAIAIKLTSPGPILFIQERVGIDGRPFPCVKFRSMRTDAEASTGPVWASPSDDRTTLLGRFLRRFSIDELPQLVNVLVGDMSLVGPRPERPLFVEQFRRLVPRYEKRHQEKAGVTGWAQVNGLRGQTSIEERTRYDLFYVERWSPPFDLKILLKTIAAVLRGRNAY